MSVLVKIPTQLRSVTGGAAEVEVAASNVSEVIDALETAHPGVRERLLDADGHLRRFVNIYVNDEDVRFLDGLGTGIGEGAKVAIIPAVAGGSSR